MNATAGPIYTSQKIVNRPTQVLRGLVGGTQTAPQKPVKCQQIDGTLHVVTMFQHGVDQCLVAVCSTIRPQVIALVIQNPVTPLMLEHQVCEAHEHAVKTACRQNDAVSPGKNVLPTQAVELVCRKLSYREPELHLGQA